MLNDKVILILILVSFIFQSGCTDSVARAFGEMQTPTPQPTATATAVPRPTATPTPLPPGLSDLSVWVDPSAPPELLRQSRLFGLVKKASQAEQADLVLDVLTPAEQVDGSLPVISWIYAVVVPFPSLVDETSLDDLQAAWHGAPRLATGRPLLMSASTRAVFARLWGGAPSGAGVQVVEDGKPGGGSLLEAAWQSPFGWALVPFEQLEPRWKTLKVNGVSVLENKYEVFQRYPLFVNFVLRGKPEALAVVREEMKTKPDLLPTLNRDPAKLTTLVLTGTTALVRETALRIEDNGVDYPGQDILHWLRDADFAHISNEVPFDPNCPPAKPLRREARFCSDPQYLQLFQMLGVDVIELTGNHLLDWGHDPVRFTLELYRKNNFKIYGGGANLTEARQPLLLEHNGNKLALIGCNTQGPPSAWATDTLPGSASCDLNWMEAEVKRLAAEGYLPVVTFQHFELCTFKPQSEQKVDFLRFSRAGAVIVSGSQSHCPQSMTLVGQKFVHYGLGNLFFDQMDPYASREFLDRHVFYGGRYIGTELLTAQLEDYARPRPMKPDERQKFLEEVFADSTWEFINE